MLAVRLVTLATLFLPLSAISAYNPDRIKDAIGANQTMFSVTGWKKADKDNGWVAETPERLLSLTVSDNISTVRSPHISPKQKVISKKRCVELGLIGINPISKEEKEKVSYLVKMATQKHITQFTDINGIRFEVLPEMKGTYVSLLCRIKPSAI